MLASAIAITESDESIAERYESLIRIATSIRAQKEPRELFGILVHELGQVVHFDAIAQFDEASNKVAFHLGPGCLKREECPSEIDKEESIAAWVHEHQESLVLRTLDRETRFPATTRIMQRAGIQSVCAFPLTTAQRRLGCLVIASLRRNAYSADEIRW